MVDVIDLTQKLIACPSVTPFDAGAQAILVTELEKLGFTCWSLPFGEGEDRVENLFARLGTSSPHICFAGHTDVVPAGDEAAWTHGAFNPVIDDGRLYGRGASDMKGAVAAFVAGIAAYLQEGSFNPQAGSISLLITGDEEGDAINGTIKVLEWMDNNGHTPDFALVGEPTNPDHLGQEIKIGRRGSLNGTLVVAGKQGHVAYQHLAQNPLPILAQMVSALSSYEFDKGNDFFAPTNLEFSTIDTGNKAANVIPAQATARFNVRFNDHWSAQTLSDQIKSLLDAISSDYTIKFSSNSGSFITQPNDWTACVQNAVLDVTGHKPAYTTSGGTSDARFIVNYCPVVECGPVNATIHQIDEYAEVQTLRDLTSIYTRVLHTMFNGD